MRTLGAFRRLTADLPDDTPLLTDAPDHCYRHPGCEVTTAIFGFWSGYAQFEPDIGNNPELYEYRSKEEVRKNRHTVVVII